MPLAGLITRGLSLVGRWIAKRATVKNAARMTVRGAQKSSDVISSFVSPQPSQQGQQTQQKPTSNDPLSFSRLFSGAPQDLIVAFVLVTGVVVVVVFFYITQVIPNAVFPVGSS